jgi:thiol-disulfide isomerase/thioredoxin
MRTSTRSRYWKWLRDLAIVAVVVLAIRAYQQRDHPSGRAPALIGVDLDGRPVALSDYRGKPVLLHFWATWCGVCRAGQGNLDAVAADHAVLSVASASGPGSDVAAYVRKHAVEPRVVVDEHSHLARRFGVSAFPTTFVLDAEGVIRHVEVGYTTQLGLRARLWLAGW